MGEAERLLDRACAAMAAGDPETCGRMLDAFRKTLEGAPLDAPAQKACEAQLARLRGLALSALDGLEDARAWMRDLSALLGGLDVSAGLVFSDETHAISAAIGAQGVALMSRQLIEDELREGRLMQPFGPEMEGKPFHLVYPESRRDDPTVRAVREWVMKVPGGLCELTG